jgi:hypothetical protein
MAPVEKELTMAEQHEEHGRGFFRSPTGYVFIAFIAIGGYFLWTEHRAHLWSILPFLILLACPLMHLFHGHGGHGRGEDESEGHAGHAKGDKR